MKWILALFLVGVVKAFPVLDPKEDTIQPFNVSPGNVNPDEYFAKVYANGGNSKFVSPPPSSPFGVPVLLEDDHGEHNEDSHEADGLVKRVRRSPQHGHGHGGHYGGGGGHYGGGGGHYGGGGGHYGGGGGGNYGGGGGHYGGHGHHYG